MKKIDEKSKYSVGRGTTYQIKTLIILCSFCFKSRYTELFRMLLLFSVKSLVPSNHTLRLAPYCPPCISESAKITLVGETSLYIIFWGCRILIICLINKNIFFVRIWFGGPFNYRFT